MFKSKPASAVDPATTDTLIGEGSVFEGNITSKASIRVEGTMQGDIHCDGDVVIGENGNAHSNISARHVVIAGEVHGEIQASGMLTITSKGRLEGNVSAANLVIEQGARFTGTSSMRETAEAPQAQPQAKSKASTESNAIHADA
ncbi:bactofilin family protein [Marinicrinis sediminis]|uniref:Polymer-forming cytoskeletal protein n=1 Tax=Marinicrinis sediminis TaxID=1652465 RepID=A0ABW5R7J8_9BACL